MSWEQPVYSFSERGEEPPTPKTPTSATFLRTSFETPKQESSFYDPRVTWNTADPCATSPDFLKTPKFQTFSTSKGSPSLAGLGRKRRFSGADVGDEIASHEHYQTPTPNITLPPVGVSGHLSASPNPSLSSSSTRGSRRRTAKSALNPLKLGLEEGIEPSIRSAGSMQTPPPTSTSTSRRKTEEAQAAKLAKQSDGNTRRMSTPAIPKSKSTEAGVSQMEESPLQLGDFQFSPLAFDFPTAGASTAPVYPQHKLFWNPDQNKDAMNLDFPVDDPFPVGIDQRSLETFGVNNKESRLAASSHYDNPLSSQKMDSSMLLDLDLSHQPDFLPSARMMIEGKSLTKYPSKAVNPSLLFSSPGRLAAQNASAEVYNSDALQPYAQQVREAQIENELSMQRRSRKRSKPSVDSPAVKAALQVLRDEDDLDSDSNETAADRALDLIRKSRSQRNRVSFQSSKTSVQIRHRGSHRLGRSGISRPRKKRPVVTLTIDAQGRAKTETKTVCDDDSADDDDDDDDDDDESSSNSRMELDRASEDSETTSSSGSTIMLLSRPQSFSLPNQKHRKQNQVRFSTDATIHSQKPSYSSTSTLSNTATGLKVIEDPNRPRAPALGPGVDVRRRSHAVNGLQRPSVTTLEDRGNMRGNARNFKSDTESVISSDDEKGDAQAELKKIIRDRARDREARLDNGHVGDAHAYVSRRDRRQQIAFPSQSAHGRAGNAYDNISPTTITDPGSSTPSSGYETTRCVCQLSEIDGELMILCDSCKCWLHVGCVGLNRHNLPQVYLCVFCTGQTPNVRGGRVREPTRATYTSPSAHKSHRYR